MGCLIEDLRLLGFNIVTKTNNLYISCVMPCNKDLFTASKYEAHLTDKIIFNIMYFVNE